MQKPFIFALARFRRRFEKQPWEVILFNKEGIELRSGGSALEVIPYPELKSLTFIKGTKTIPRALAFLTFEPLAGAEHYFEIVTESLQLEVKMEFDSRYRQESFQQLFTLLYRLGIPLREYRGKRPMFLMEEMPKDEVEQAIEKLQAEGSIPNS